MMAIWHLLAMGIIASLSLFTFSTQLSRCIHTSNLTLCRCVSTGRNLRRSSTKSHRLLCCSHTRWQRQAVQKGKFAKPVDTSYLCPLYSTTARFHSASLCSLAMFHFSGKNCGGLNQNVLKVYMSLYCWSLYGPWGTRENLKTMSVT